MHERFSQRLLRAVLIAIPLLLMGTVFCGGMAATDFSALCLSLIFVGVVSLVISWLLSGLVRKQRFVRVPRPEYFDDEDVADEKPKRGE